MEKRERPVLVPGSGFRAARELPRYSRHSVFLSEHLNSPRFKRRSTKYKQQDKEDAFAEERERVLGSLVQVAEAEEKKEQEKRENMRGSLRRRRERVVEVPDASFWKGSTNHFDEEYEIGSGGKKKLPPKLRAPGQRRASVSAAAPPPVPVADYGGYTQMMHAGGYTPINLEVSVDADFAASSLPRYADAAPRLDVPSASQGDGYGSYPGSPTATRHREPQPQTKKISTELLDRFHDCLELLSRSPKPSTEIQMQCHQEITTLMLNFERDAVMYGRVIISELSLPLEQKTIKPLESSGILGGDKYIVNGCYYYKFATDRMGMFGGNEDAAHKVAGHEMKSLVRLMEAGIPALRFPLVCLVDYLGCRLIAMSALPIQGRASLVYGSMDGGRTVEFDNLKAMEMMSNLGSKLNLKQHKVRGHEKYEIKTPTDLEIHMGSDGNFYALDFSRLFPPDVAKKGVQGGVFYQMLRSELVGGFHKPLSSDAWTSFTTEDEADEAVEEIQEAHRHLVSLIEAFAAQLPEQPSQGSQELDGRKLVNQMHMKGINVRYLGRIRSECKSVHWRRVILSEMIQRRLKKQLHELLRHELVQKQTPGVAPCQSAAISFLNLVFGESDASSRFWERKIRHSVRDYFAGAFEGEEVPFGQWKKQVMASSPNFRSELLKCFCAKTGLVLSPLTQQAIVGNPNALLVSRPFDDSDVMDLGSVVTYLPVASLSQAKLASIKATRTKQRAKAFELNKSAATLYSSALRMSPADPQLLRNCAEIYAALGDNHLAAEHFRSALTVAPNDDATAFKCALYNDHALHVDEAERWYLRALALGKKRHRLAVFATTYADFLLTARNNSAAASKVYENALQVMPDNPQALHNFAMLLAISEPERASKLMRKAVMAADDGQRAMFNRDYAAILKAQGKTRVADELMATFRPSAAKPASNPPTLYHACTSSQQMLEVREILGPSHAFKVRQVALDRQVVGDTHKSLVEGVSSKVRKLSHKLHVPCSCEVSFLTCGESFTVTEDRFDSAVVKKFQGQPAKIGVIVAYHDYDEGLLLFEEMLDGTIQACGGPVSTWDDVFSINGFGKTIAQLYEYKAMLNVRRRAYLRMWTRVSDKFTQ